jgi:hypothetical protein
LGIHPDASPLAKIDLDPPIRAAGTGRSRLASSEKLRIFLAPFPPRRQYAPAQNTADLLDHLRLPSLGEHHARRNTVAACNFGRPAHRPGGP